ncbi:MAG: peptidyl-tRNA hydrolase [Cyclobacteriaceae bacterium]|nr:MAG: peptidyl-tRNA hydrolase [Cyclobacteriaceae bacterium]
MKSLIVGLGNIGPEYELTRHNIGFLILDQLAENQKVEFEIAKSAYHCEFRFKGKSLHLIKPTTFMNLSGKAVNYWQQQLKIDTSNTLVVTDDIALPFGTLRLRAKGSNAGHNGLKNIEATLGTNQYPRLRCGIGDDYRQGQQVDYVLSRFSQEEFEELPSIMDKAIEVILGFATIGIDRTMNQFN